MKKIVAVAVFLFAVAVTGIFGAEVTGKRLLFDLNDYLKCFADREPRDKSKVRIALDYYGNVQGTHKDAVAQFAQLDETPEEIDTAIEWLCASYYHVAVRDIRPQEAEAILPADNPKLADLKIGAVIFQEIQILHFLGNTATKGRYEGILKFITDRKNVTRAEIEECYRNSIRGLIAGIVDEEFNKISFLLQGSPNGSYNVVLTREENRCVLNYEGYFDSSKQTKTLTASSLDALVSEMRNNRVDFNADAIRNFQDQAKLIPAVAFSTAEIQTIKNELTDFYLNPNRDTLLVLQQRYRRLSLAERERGVVASTALHEIVFSLNPELARRVTTNN